jgi:hypothetical protein
MVSRTMRITASALAFSVLEVGDSVGNAPGAQPVSSRSAQITESKHRAMRSIMAVSAGKIRPSPLLR